MCLVLMANNFNHTDMRLVESKFEVVDFDAEKTKRLIERVGRTCYRSESKIQEGSASEFIKMIVKREHTSILEHSQISVLFTVSRGIADEIRTHRVGNSFAMESTRYCNYGKSDIEFVIPVWVIDHWESIREMLTEIPEKYKITDRAFSSQDLSVWANGLVSYARNLLSDNLMRFEEVFNLINPIYFWMSSLCDSESKYKNLLRMGLKPQAARGVLPLDLRTCIWVTGNLRSWKHYMDLRDNNAAHPDMRDVMHSLHLFLRDSFSEVFNGSVSGRVNI